jgi:hypothetical protein
MCGLDEGADELSMSFKKAAGVLYQIGPRLAEAGLDTLDTRNLLSISKRKQQQTDISYRPIDP